MADWFSLDPNSPFNFLSPIQGRSGGETEWMALALGERTFAEGVDFQHRGCARRCSTLLF